ncbi:protein phosphatase 2A regulatory B subunit [Sporodiniella umbellata]|nr:protein phosphatase 2A regulatory B subunit [Sporodiniella umbellata]
MGPIAKSPKKRRSSRFHANGKVELEKMPLLKETPSSKRTDLFVQKLILSQIKFDFTDPDSNLKEKEIKRQVLQDMLEYVATTPGAITEPVYSEVFRMVSVNLLRTLPPCEIDQESCYEAEEDEPVLESSWPHLQLVYEFFLRFIESKEFNVNIAKRYIDPNFVVQFLGLFDSSDPRERDFVKTILHRLYGRFLGLRSFIRKSINHIFFQFVYETEKFNGIAELLEILGSIINGFATPLKEEHRVFLNRVLLLLYKPTSLPLYNAQLTYCIIQFVEKDPSLTKGIVDYLIRYWPKLNSTKQVIYLGVLEDLLDTSDPIDFQKIMVPIFQKVAQSIASTHFQVAERALLFWNNDYILSMVQDNIDLVLPIVFESLYMQSHNHWNSSIHLIASDTLKILENMDPVLAKQYKLNREK